MPPNAASAPRIVCLSNVFGAEYNQARGEKIAPSLSSPKRRDLFACLERALGREVVVLSVPPKAMDRRQGRWLPEVATSFHGHRQWFAPNWDRPKLRVPLSWFFYLRHVLRHTRSGDLVVIDNFEFVYVVAVLGLRLLRRVTFVLEYEDGKHLIETSWPRLLSASAEWLAKPLLSAAVLAHPVLQERLPPALPVELVPGFVVPTGASRPTAMEGETVHFLYSGTLDEARGVDLILQALELLPPRGWHLHMTGIGPLESTVARVARDPRWQGRLTFHGSLESGPYQALVQSCQVGLNCQKQSDPISGVTFPSKLFTYLSAGLEVVSSRASQAETICGAACYYYGEDTPQAIAQAMTRWVEQFAQLAATRDRQFVFTRYSMESTALRLRRLLGPLCPERGPDPVA